MARRDAHRCSVRQNSRADGSVALEVAEPKQLHLFRIRASLCVNQALNATRHFSVLGAVTREGPLVYARRQFEAAASVTAASRESGRGALSKPDRLEVKEAMEIAVGRGRSP